MKTKFLKHRQILLSNYEEAETEIKRLDEIYHETVHQVLTVSGFEHPHMKCLKMFVLPGSRRHPRHCQHKHSATATSKEFRTLGQCWQGHRERVECYEGRLLTHQSEPINEEHDG